jgi:fatty-acyl-CoA synthase
MFSTPIRQFFPHIWRFVEQFPQTASGKIQKFMLRDAYLSHEARSVEMDI